MLSLFVPTSLMGYIVYKASGGEFNWSSKSLIS